MIIKDDLIFDLRRVGDIFGRIPSKSEYNKIGKYSRNTVCRKFGKKWSDAIFEVFGDSNKAYPKQVETKCEYEPCSKTFLSGIGVRRKRFCSVICSNKARKDNPLWKEKRIKVKRYCSCGEELIGRRILCDDCIKLKSLDCKTVGSFKHLKDANRYGQIREAARKIAKNITNKCFHCGYDLHVEVCHIKEIGKFPDDTPISEINRIENLVKLCKNHHWELDKGFLKI